MEHLEDVASGNDRACTDILPQCSKADLLEDHPDQFEGELCERIRSNQPFHLFFLGLEGLSQGVRYIDIKFRPTNSTCRKKGVFWMLGLDEKNTTSVGIVGYHRQPLKAEYLSDAEVALWVPRREIDQLLSAPEARVEVACLLAGGSE